MACRVGMSTNPYERIEHWKRVEGHTNGAVLATNLTHAQAQAREHTEAAARGCYSAPGGPNNGRNDWAVYVVSGGTIGS